MANGSSAENVIIRFDLSCTFWVNSGPSKYEQITASSPTVLPFVCSKNLVFKRFKYGVIHHLDLTSGTDLDSVLKTADNRNLLEWRFSPSNNPNDVSHGPSKLFVVKDDTSLKAFLAFEEQTRIQDGDSSGRPTIEIIMSKPIENPSSVSPSKRRSTANPDRPGLDPSNIDMEAFLKICHIPLRDKHTRALITIHRLHHWTVFDYLSIEELKSIKFSLGPAILLNAGVTEINRRIDSKEESKEDDEASTSKRSKLNLDPKTLEMEAFLKLSHFPLTDKHTRSLITIHRIHHWSVFKYLTVEEMRAIKFRLGPAILINAGVSEVNRQAGFEDEKCGLVIGERSKLNPDGTLIPETGSSIVTEPSLDHILSNQDRSRLDPDKLEMEDFLKICYIPADCEHTRITIFLNFIHHWSVFKYLSLQQLKDISFSLGPAILINAGVSEVIRLSTSVV
ncbi:hypothetical protein H4Q26_014337 [Puccinia striiformis f. sp. tritici PST-130]|nr:hypothetical protein Pst134EB_012818 [Puccinia striiformis f. sp. tritici]KAI9619568.1 hypothetical protein H4Q26_014337 [Puccinia striiformis f. sp. tritici PST-130]